MSARARRIVTDLLVVLASVALVTTGSPRRRRITSRAPQLTSPSRRGASCRPNRGREGSPLFLLNHWITTAPVPRPSDAAKVNAYGPLLARARACGRIRRNAVTVVAVSFYRRGDVFRVVDTLNGVRRAREPPAGAPVH